MVSRLCSFSFLFFLLSFFAGSAYASNIVEITVDEIGIPFVLDDEGQVWGFRKPYSLEEPIKLSNLNHIKKIAPYIAVDTEGRVFTWSIDDAEVETVEGEITEAGYTTPQRFGDMKGVTLVAHSMNHFFAVINNQEIVEWLIIRKENKPGGGFGVEGYGPIKKIISSPGVKAIAAAPGTMARIVAEPAPYGLVALFDDGTVMGWGISSSGQIVKDANTPSILLTKSPGAVGIAMNDFHTVILSAQGVPQFWGGCDLYGRDGNGGHPWTHGSVHGAEGYVADVIGMAIAQDINIGVAGGWGNDNGTPDVFIKRDGTVWIAYAPIPENTPNFDCGQYKTANPRQAVQVSAGKAIAVQVATARGFIFMLDADHKLWTTPSNLMVTKFSNVPLNIK